MSDILSHSSDERFGFITQILAADTAAHESVARFRQLLQEDMRALLNEAEIPSPVTTEVLFRLHAVADSMELMASSSAVRTNAWWQLPEDSAAENHRSSPASWKMPL